MLNALFKGSIDDGYIISGNAHQRWAPDVYGFELSYYQAQGTQHADYTPVGTITTAALPFTIQGSSSGLYSQAPQLYNGNIRNMTTGIAPFMESGAAPLAFAYKYDQLNRISKAQAFNNLNMTTNEWGSGGALPWWYNQFTYDANGNILTQIRRGSTGMAGSGVAAMDSLTYHYSGSNNKLLYVDDGVSSANYADDIDDQSSGNYAYDNIGNLVTDVKEEIDLITWNVYGKITTMTRTVGSTKPGLAFEYAADGQRIIKIVKPQSDEQPWVYTYYVRDAQGNIMATYTRSSSRRTNSSPVTFGDINNFVIQEQDSASWRSFMQTASVDSGSFRSDYIYQICNNSLTANMLSEVNLIDYYVASYSGRLHNALSTYSNAELVTCLMANVGNTSFATAYFGTVSFTSGSFILDAVNANKAGFLGAFYTQNSTQYDIMYSIIMGTSSPGLPNCITNLLPSGNESMIAFYYGSVMSSIDFVTLLGYFSDAEFASVFNAASGMASTLSGLYTESDLTGYFKSCNRMNLCNRLVSSSTMYGWTATDWTNFFITASSSASYTTALAKFVIYAGYTQDLNWASYNYTKEDYLRLLRNYYGTTFYNKLVHHFMLRTIDLDLATFTTINNQIRTDRGDANWRGFMQSSDIASATNIKIDAVANRFEYGQGTNYLYHVETFNSGLLAFYYASYGSVISTMVSIGADTLVGLYRNYDNKTNVGGYLSASSSNYSSMVSKAVMSHRTEFLTMLGTYDYSTFYSMYTDLYPTGVSAPSVAAMIADMSGVTSADIISWWGTHASSSTFAGVISYMGDASFDDICGAAGSAVVAPVLLTSYATAVHVNLLKTFTLLRFSYYTSIQQTPSWWGSFFNYTQTIFDAYVDLLNYFPEYVNQTMDSMNYMSKEDYLRLVKLYFGTSYYDQLEDELPQGMYFVEKFKLDELYLYGSSRLGSHNANLMLLNKHFNATFSHITGLYTSLQNEVDSVQYTVPLHYKYIERGVTL